MKPDLKASLQRYALELVLYAVLVTVYYFLVLHFLGHGLENLYRHQRKLYAGLALGLIVGQGLVLEILTRFLLSWISAREEAEGFFQSLASTYPQSTSSGSGLSSGCSEAFLESEEASWPVRPCSPPACR